MAWQVYCKHCYHIFPITPESVASDQSPADATLTVNCPNCQQTDEYAASDLANFDLPADDQEPSLFPPKANIAPRHGILFKIGRQSWTLLLGVPGVIRRRLKLSKQNLLCDQRRKQA